MTGRVIWLVLLSTTLTTVADEPDALILIDTRSSSHAVPPEMNGCHYSPLNHQLTGVFAQLVYDESFEQAITDKPSAPLPDNQTSLGWTVLPAAARGADEREVDGGEDIGGTVNAAAAAAAAAVEREGVLQADPEAHGGRQRGGARRHLREEAAGVRLARNELVTLMEEAAAGGADAGARRRGCRK